MTHGSEMAQEVEKAPLARMLGTFWTLANGLSLLRLVLVFPIAYLILTEGPRAWLFGLIGLVVVTDFFDGRVARWSRTVSEWGKVLDPLADKVAAAVILLALVLRDRDSLPGWFLALVVGRDVLIVLGGVMMARKTATVAMSLWLGKIAVGATALTVLAALLQADPDVMRFCLAATSVLIVLSFLQYLVRFFRLMYGARGAGSAEA